LKYWVEGYCTRKNLCVEIAPNDENTPLDYSLCALRHALMRSFSFCPLLPAPCPSPFSASSCAFATCDLRLTVFDHYFDLLGIFCYDAVISGFPL